MLCYSFLLFCQFRGGRKNFSWAKLLRFSFSVFFMVVILCFWCFRELLWHVEVSLFCLRGEGSVPFLDSAAFACSCVLWLLNVLLSSGSECPSSVLHLCVSFPKTPLLFIRFSLQRETFRGRLVMSRKPSRALCTSACWVSSVVRHRIDVLSPEVVLNHV